MKTNLLQTRIFCAVALGIGSSFGLAAATEDSADTPPATTAIPWSQLGANAGADYQGDALAVIPTAEGARLRCAFQRLESEATREGLWLTSTVIPPGGTVNDRFRLLAVEVGRGTPSTLRSAATEGCAPSAAGGATDRSANIQPSTSGIQLQATGNVSIDGQSVRFTRPGLVEEYTASMDGVRQDFVVLERPPGLGEMVLRLAVSGARVESAALGAQVVLANSGRKIAYSRLKVTDANGRELPARMKVANAPESKIENQKSEILRVAVNDAEAVYPVRIDPTFSDANWSSMRADNPVSGVSAAVVDGSGNLYIGGEFTLAGEVIESHVAKWNGSSWTALGSGINGSVYALAVSGSDLYAGGSFTTAGGSTANSVAKWNGNSWSALGSGMNGSVYALAVSATDLYAAGGFTTAGGKVSAYVARAYLPALPTIAVLRSGENVTVSWPTVDTAGFALEQTGPLAAPAGWVPNSAIVTNDGTNKSVTLPATNSSQFYRLRRP